MQLWSQIVGHSVQVLNQRYVLGASVDKFIQRNEVIFIRVKGLQGDQKNVSNGINKRIKKKNSKAVKERDYEGLYNGIYNKRLVTLYSERKTKIEREKESERERVRDRERLVGISIHKDRQRERERSKCI